MQTIMMAKTNNLTNEHTWGMFSFVRTEDLAGIALFALDDAKGLLKQVGRLRCRDVLQW